MAIEDKVDYEMEIDQRENNGLKKRKVLEVTARHGVDTEFNKEILGEISEILGHDSYYRAWEWHRRAVAEIKELPVRERTKLGWKGSDEVTDLASFRKKRDKGPRDEGPIVS
jgi:hypothetical protein